MSISYVCAFLENVSFFRYAEEDKKLTELWLEEGVYTGQSEKGKPHGQVYYIYLYMFIWPIPERKT
jgi:hypothetical protein